LKNLSFLPFVLSSLCIILIPFQAGHQSNLLVLSFISIVSMAIGVYLLRRRVVRHPILDSRAVNEERKRLLVSLGHARHDWLNHFQVLLGYLKLERYEFCEEYIKKVTESTNNDSRVAQLGLESLVAYLLTFNAMYREMVIEVDLSESIDLSQNPGLDRVKFCELVMGVIEVYRKSSINDQGAENTLVLLIRVVEDKSLYVSVEYEGSFDSENCLSSLYTLVEKLGNEDGCFVEGLHNSRESIMEFYFPLGVKEEV
jgi:stage 0 sporulation protein B (sporulation initiation phosphotransferase)